ncbi:MAG: oligoendopeptidase F, partial [Gammaproteobacteria bacterium]|nr:oligoendopeptidase F [Gammaproteobacteria bacterium]
MRKTIVPIAAIFAALFVNCTFANEEVAVDPQHTWDLTDLYSSVEAWDQARKEVLAEYDAIEARRGTLGDSADSLYSAYRHVSDTLKKAGRVAVYASLNSHEDLRVTDTQERDQLGNILFARFGEATAWMQPELLEVGREVIESYIKEDERLEPFAYELDNSLRNAPHTLGAEAEQTLSYFSQSFGAPADTYTLLTSSDIPWPTITLSTGEEVRLDSQGYGRARGSQNREDRKKVFDAFWNKWAEYRNSVG